jgi:DNA-damage-inducible protein D
METRIALFQKKEIRKTLHADEWWFVIVDVVAALTDSANPAGYLKDMRRRDAALAEALKGGGQIAPPLALEFLTAGGPQKLTCWHTEGIFRLIQSIPSPKAEPFKRWLAKVGYERVQEIENPELATKRTRALYLAKGYSAAWIEKRMRSIAIRDELTDEWKKRGVREKLEYAILTAEISKAAFGLTPAEYAAHKGPETPKSPRPHDRPGADFFHARRGRHHRDRPHHRRARASRGTKSPHSEGGTVSGNARRELEKKSGRKIVSRENYLDAPESIKRLSRPK